jgi:hypothetical protein
MGTRDPIAVALSAWPADRFPPNYVSFWQHELRFYPAKAAGEAIDALRMKSDPFAPTIDAVTAILDEWGIVPAAAPPPPPKSKTWVDQRNAVNRAKIDETEAQNMADNALVRSLDDATFVELARQVINNLEPAVRALVEKRDPRKQQMIRSLVANLVRRKDFELEKSHTQGVKNVEALKNA